MTLVLFGWLITQPYFKDLTNSDIRRNLANETLKEVHDDLLPAGFIDDGGVAQSMERNDDPADMFIGGAMSDDFRYG